MEVRGFGARVLGLVVRAWNATLLRIQVDGDRAQVSFLPSEPAASGIDERLAQIDRARESLESALPAVNELGAAAERNKAELRDALELIEHTRAEKAMAEHQLQNLKEIAQADIEVFRSLVGIPSRAQIARERIIGFILGVIASLIASGIFWALVRG